jgi:predicted amidophosphoribosyltransferase
LSLFVVSFASYLTDVTFQQWRPEDYDASKFIKAIKGDSLNKYAQVPVRGVRLRLENSNRADAVGWFAQMAADYLTKDFRLNPEASFGLVPVPSSDAVNKATFSRFPARDLANALAKELQQAGIKRVGLADVLRWTQKLPSARKAGGSRDAGVLLPKLVLTQKLTGFDFYIMVDDVLTSGGHLQACAALVRKNGGQLAGAVCAGRTRQIAVDDPFKPATEELEDLKA